MAKKVKTSQARELGKMKCGFAEALTTVLQNHGSWRENHRNTPPLRPAPPVGLGLGLVSRANQTTGHIYHLVPLLKNTPLHPYSCAWVHTGHLGTYVTTLFRVLEACVNVFSLLLAPYLHLPVLLYDEYILHISERNDLSFLSAVSRLLTLLSHVAARSAGHGQGWFKKKCHGFICSFKRLLKMAFYMENFKCTQK